MKFDLVPLAELCEMDRRHVRSTDPDAAKLRFVGLEHVAAGSGAINFDTDSRVGNQKATAFRFDSRHVLYGKLRPYLNKVATPDFAGRCTTELIPLLPREGVDRDFLAHLLRREQTVDFVMASVTGARMPRTDMNVLMSMTVHLPPLQEQRRIVAILTRAAKIERLRARAAKCLGDFVPALFARMFGDPIENPLGWDIASLGDVIKGFEAGKNLKAGSGGRLRVLKVSAVTTGTFDPSMSKPLPDDYVAPGHHHVRVGDLLITRANTTALVGATAMVEQEAPSVLLPDKIWRFAWQENSPVAPRFIHGLLQNKTVRSLIGALASGTGGSMKNISQAKLKTLPVIVPPLEIQVEYERVVHKARGLLLRAEEAATATSDLSGSLMERMLLSDGNEVSR